MIECDLVKCIHCWNGQCHKKDVHITHEDELCSGYFEAKRVNNEGDGEK